MNSKRALPFNPALAAVALFVVLAAGSLGISAMTTSQAVPSVCETDATIVGTNQADVIVGTPGDDVIIGKPGDDRIRGLQGNDIICGRGGNDEIRGGNDDDIIVGGTGDDEIRGGNDDDQLTGGQDFDTLYGNNGFDLCNGEVEHTCEEATPTPSATPSTSPSPTPTATASPTPKPHTPNPNSNKTPVAANDTYGTDEDQTLNVAAPGVLANDTDPNGDILTASVVTDPAHGSLDLNDNGSFEYEPDPNYNGPDSFTYSADDPVVSSVPATVTINVAPIADAPAAIAQSTSTDEDASKTVSLFGSDPDGTTPSVFKITELPAHGGLRDGTGLAGHLIVPADLPYTLSGNTTTYIPAANYFGADDFEFKANDGALDSSSATVSITVVFVNDAPTDLALSNSSVDEEQPAGTTVGNLSTTDPDAGDIHNYSLVAGAGDADNSRFTITGGVLKTGEVFDFENQGPFSVRVRTTDAAGLSFEKQFAVTLNNVNDVPVVPDATYSLPENSANGTAVGTPTVNDQDAGQTHTWSITSGNAAGAFAIDPSTGAVTVADTSALDFEATPQFVLTVRAEDNGSPAKADTGTVTVDLSNVNEIPTDLDLTGTSVAENEAAGADVGTLSTTDPDAGDTHTYSLVAGLGDGDNGKFQITSGVLETAQAFDFETQGPFSVRIRTRDAGNLDYEEVVSISVTDANDAPVVSPATVGLDENSPNGTAVHTVSATDEDLPAQTLTHSITGGNTLGAFAIDQSTGAITVADVSDLDFETNPSFALTVKTEDDGTPAKDDSDTITINLNDLNEAPVVNAATLSLPENSANGTSVGTATFSDQDAGQSHTFALTGGNTGGAFQINTNNGEITVADANDVDFETNPTFALTVEVTDNGSPNLAGSNTVTVNLSNVNEVPTDLALTSTSVPENSPTVTDVGTFSSVDPDAGDTYTYGLVAGTGDTDNARFTVTPAGLLKTAETFDFETQGPFSIRAATTDAGSLTREEVFTITITNVNEAPVVDAATVGLDENSANGTSVGTATLTDPDAGQTHTWAITGGNAGGAFQINSGSGEITVADASDLDFETTPSFALTVQATDDGTPALDDADTITVNLNDVNDAPAVSAATFGLAENSANGTSVGTASATDQDLPAQTLAWAITGGNTGGAFQINSGTGEITVADTSDVDFETNHPFSLTVEATDNGSPNRSGSNTVTVNLTNVNEAPVITAPSTVSAQYTVAKAISGISVSDPDAGSNDIAMTLGVLDGTLSVDDSVLNGLVAGDVTGNGTDAVTLTASQSKINNTLAAAGGLTYTSDGGFSGLSDTLAIATNDAGNTGSGPAQADAANVTIQFNTPPVATDQTVSTNEDIEKTITLAGTDADADPLTFKVTSLPATGKLHEGTSSAGTEITAGALPYTLTATDKVTYVPPLNQNGLALETFQFKANDGIIDSTAATVTVDVSAVDDLPVAVLDTPTVVEDSGANTIDVLLNDTDVDAGPKTIDSKTNGTNGTVAITNSGADLTYTPNANYCNNPPTVPVDTFTYTLNGGSVGNVNVTVTCVDDFPVAVNDTKTMNEDAGATTIDVLANDTDQDAGPKLVNLKTNGTNGTVAITNSGADLTYTPAANYCNDPPGTTLDTFTYTLNGGSVGTVTVTVTCVDDAPVAVNDTKTVLEDALATTINVLANDTDVDGGPKFVDAKSNSTNGGTVTITNAGADLTYTPAANYCNDPELQPAGGNLTETFTYTLNGTPASVGTVTVTVTCVNDPPTADTENFNGTDSALSNVKFDNGTSFGGLKVAPATLHNVLAGDTDIEGDTISLIAGADCTGTGPFTCLTDGYDPDNAPGGQPVERGTVTLEADGDFHYTPPAGHIGSDSFDYRVSDGQAQNAESNGTVNINVVGPTTWFVDDSAGAGGNGTSAAPFQTFTPLTTAGASNHLDDANDTIFVYEGSYTAGVVLENGQRLLGHPHSLDITDTASRTHTDLVSSAGTAPAISHAANTVVTLGSGNELQDLALGNGTISLAGTSVGTATVRDTSISTTGKALDINGGTMDMVFSTLTSTSSGTEAIKLNNAAGSLTANGGTLTNATNAVVDITGATQDVTIAGNISDGSGQVISIASTTGGTKDFNGTINGATGGSGPRVNLTNNTGSTIRFDNDVILNTGSLPAFSATGGGTLHMPSDDNILTTTTGIPLNVVNTTIGAGDLIFDSISANGAANGIVLDNTGNTGNLNVTGTGPAASGGTIANADGGDAATNQCAKPAGQPAGIGILLKDTSSVVLNDMVLNGSDNYGLLGHDVNGFTLDDSTFSGTHGTNEGQDEGSAMFCDLTGSATISDSVIGGGYENSLTVTNAGGSLNRLTVTNTDLATSLASVADDAFQASSTGNATFHITVDGASAFTRAGGDLFQYAPSGTSTSDLDLLNSAFSNDFPTISSGGGGVTLNPGGGGSNVNANYTVTGNTFQDARGNALSLTTGGPGSSGTTGTYVGTITNNTFGVNGVAGSAASDIASGIRLLHTGNGTHTLSITGNTIQGYTSNGIRMIANDGTPTVRATVTGNTIRQPGPLSFSGISIEPGTTISPATMCLDLGTVASQNSVSTGDPSNANDININPNGNTTLNLPGYVGPVNGAGAVTAVQTYLTPRNSGDGAPTIFVRATGASGTTIQYTGTGLNCL